MKILHQHFSTILIRYVVVSSGINIAYTKTLILLYIYKIPTLVEFVSDSKMAPDVIEMQTVPSLVLC